MSEKAPPAESEMSGEEKIAAAKAKAEAIKAQRATGAPAPTAAGQGAAGQAAPPAATAAKPAPRVPGKATAANPGGTPPAAPQNPNVEAFGTITQGVELRAEASEAQNLERLLGGLGLYHNPVRGTWQLDYRYFAEARKRLEAVGYRIEGRDYLGRPLEQWAPHTRGWTRLSSPD